MNTNALAVVPTYTAGMQLYKYNLISCIGKGQFGEVWLANDLAIHRQYALKLLNPGTPVDERLREAQIGNILEHNNLVRVHQADVEAFNGDHIVMIAMDYVPNGSIVQRLNPANFMPLPALLKAAKDILQGLEYLHANHFFHNDIKPNNILMGANDQAMLTDYGIVGVSPDGNPVQAPNTYIPHAAPEVITGGHINVQTDIYQAGLTLYRLAVGISCLREQLNRLGWDEYSNKARNGNLITKSDFPSFVPGRVRNAILKAIHADPTRRYQTALEMRRDLERLAFPGYWTIGSSGELMGVNGHYRYRFDAVPTSPSRLSVTAYRKNERSGIEQRVSAYCESDLTKIQGQRLIDNFIKFVVAGS